MLPFFVSNIQCSTENVMLVEVISALLHVVEAVVDAELQDIEGGARDRERLRVGRQDG